MLACLGSPSLSLSNPWRNSTNFQPLAGPAATPLPLGTITKTPTSCSYALIRPLAPPRAPSYDRRVPAAP